MRRRRWQFLGLIAAAALPAALAIAQEAADPTRPFNAPLGAGGMVVQSGPVLQWIYLSPSRTEAMISGKVVHVGDAVGKAKVVKISESSVVLRSASGLQTLNLFPGMEKHIAAGQKPSVSGDRSQNQR